MREVGQGRAIERLALIVTAGRGRGPLRSGAHRPSSPRTASPASSSRRVRSSTWREIDGRATARLRETLAALGSEPAEVRAGMLGDPAEGRRGGERLGLSVLLKPAPRARMAEHPGASVPAAARQGARAVPFDPAALARSGARGRAPLHPAAHPAAGRARRRGAGRRPRRPDRAGGGAGARELRETARAFNEMQARIARFDAERTRTLAAVGHDLRTPITSAADPGRDAGRGASARPSCGRSTR